MKNKAYTILPTIVAYIEVTSRAVYDASERHAYATGIGQSALNVESTIETIENQDADEEEAGDQALLAILAEVRDWAGDAIIYYNGYNI